MAWCTSSHGGENPTGWKQPVPLVFHYSGTRFFVAGQGLATPVPLVPLKKRKEKGKSRVGRVATTDTTDTTRLFQKGFGQKSGTSGTSVPAIDIIEKKRVPHCSTRLKAEHF